MNFSEEKKRYAELLVKHGLNLQPGQILCLSCEAIHRDFALLVAEQAYDCGAKCVELDLIDQRFGRLRMEKSSEDDLSYVPPHLSTKYDELLKQAGANLRLVGSEDPDVLSAVDPKRVNTVRFHQRMALKRFYDEGIGRSLVHWTLGAAATPKWGLKVFPDCEPEEACRRLWGEILRIVRADREDCLDLWKEHNSKLHSRAERLNALALDGLEFHGPDTDLFVGLSPLARFMGGSSRGPRGVDFEPNLPTEEVFSAPDRRRTEGHVRATRPFFVNGRLVRNLYLTFEKGEITSFSAAEGEETFREYISSDEGAKRLGEVALVGTDSPVYQSGLVFQEILLDENAACHIAVGMAYKFCLEGADDLSAEDLEEAGFNDSSVHTDMMISSEEVDVVGRTRDGGRCPIITRGAWVI